MMWAAKAPWRPAGTSDSNQFNHVAEATDAGRQAVSHKLLVMADAQEMLGWDCKRAMAAAYSKSPEQHPRLPPKASQHKSS